MKKKNYRVNLTIGCVMLGILLLAAIFAPLITPYGYDDADLSAKLLPPGPGHIFGTDDYGRDVFSRVIFGSRIALRVAGLSVSIELVIGVLVGLLAGFFGKWVDRIMCFAMDVTWVVPSLIAAFAVISVLGKSLTNAIIAISVVSWPPYARIVRTKTMSIKNMAFLETGIAFGESTPALISHYIVPNIIPSLVVIASTSIPDAIASTTALSFLGLGAVPPSPDWGLALSESMSRFTMAPWISVFPGLALVFTTFGFTMLGEGLRDLIDPRMKDV